MHHVPDEALQGRGIDALDAAFVALCELLDATHTRIVTMLGEVHRVHALGMALEHDAHRVQTVDGFGGLQA
jgi:hypothetical protein